MKFISRGISLLAVACFVITGSLVANANAPVRYSAITDNTPRPEPPLPAMGPAGSVIVDPTFGTRILRVTDADTQPDYPGAAFMTPAGSFENNWNADSTMFWVLGRGGIIFYRFDGASMRATPLPDPKNAAMPFVFPYSGPWSYRRPNILYATKGLTVIEYDVSKNTQTVVFDAQKAVPGVGNYAYAPAISDDDSRICLAFGGQQDTHPWVAVLDRNTGRYHVLNTMTSQIDGRPTSKPLGFGIHSAYLDRSGRYVILAKGQGKAPGKSEWTVWDVETSRVYDIDAEWSGHDAAGFGVRVNQSGFYGGQPTFYEEQQWAIRGLSEGEINNYKYLIPWQNLPSPHTPIASGHHSWNNARPDVLVPVVGSLVRDARRTDVPWRAWDNEIVAIATDGSGTVYRIAHHRAVWDRSEFWDDPRGNISQDGRYFSFTSNWGKSVGANRRDVFVVELPAGAAPPPTPQPQPTPEPQPGPNPQPSPGEDAQKQVQIGAVTNAASFLATPVAPGALVTLFGNGIGPAEPAFGDADSSGRLPTSLGGFQVRLNGRPAPLLYAHADQVNLQAPYSIAGMDQVEIELFYNGVRKSGITAQVAATAPGIFTYAGGAGQAAALNEDGSLNSAQNPAAPGSIIVFWATGEGLRTPDAVEGELAEPPYGKPVLPVTVTIGGRQAEILYAGASPGFAGLMQVNARVPRETPSGVQPVELNIGSTRCQPGVTVQVR
ncbi:MAG: hypothetical protein ACM3ZB_14145 [bacterium]|jgi:uncharacterized protein (TIGR03437 family)